MVIFRPCGISSTTVIGATVNGGLTALTGWNLNSSSLVSHFWHSVADLETFTPLSVASDLKVKDFSHLEDCICNMEELVFSSMYLFDGWFRAILLPYAFY